jgi:hypothetical protein
MRPERLVESRILGPVAGHEGWYELAETVGEKRSYIVRLDAGTVPPEESWGRVLFHATGIASRGDGKVGRRGYVRTIGAPVSVPPRPSEPVPPELGDFDETPEDWRTKLSKIVLRRESGEEGAPVLPTATEARGNAEIDLVGEAEEDAVIEAGEAAPANLLVRFNESTRKFYARANGKDRVIVNAKELYLLPGDHLVSSSFSGENLVADKIKFNRSPYIAGFILKNGGRNGGYYFSVRIPEKRTLEKYKLPVTAIPDAERFHRERKVVLFDRESRTVIDHPAIAEGASDYENLKRIALTNMGAYEYDEAADEEREREQVELAWLGREYGANDLSEGADIDAQIEPAMARMADEARDAGDIEDLRDPLGGKRRTFYIDPEGSRDHDDAISIEDKGDGTYQIGIHIADVARFIAPGSALDLQARFRASSIYLDDEVIRMFPPLISEHLASLNANATRFAFSLMLDVAKDEKKHIRVINRIRFAKTAIRVTDGLTYDEAEERLPEDPMLRELMAFAQRLRMRKGIRQPGEEEINPLDMDMHQMVAEYMTTKSRTAGAAYERFKRANPEKQPNLYVLQNLVLGVYRVQELSREGAGRHLEDMKRLGILTGKEKLPNGDSADSEALARIARQRVDDGGFFEDGAWRSLGEREIEGYFRSAFFARKGAAGYQSEPGTHFSMGAIHFSRVTSPIRREADLRGQRRLQFLLKLRDAQGKEDIDDGTLRAFVREYYEDVIGGKIANIPGNEAMSGMKLLSEVERRSRKSDVEELAHDSARERLAQDAERVVGSLHTAANLYEWLYRKEWDRDDQEPPVRSFKLARTERLPNGETLQEGIVIDLVEEGERVSSAGEVYGEVTINRRMNRSLLQFVPGRLKEVGARLQVKFELPEGAVHPAAWCDDQGIYPRRVKVSGSVIDVQVEQGRIVFRLDPDGSYMDPRKARPQRPSRQFPRAKAAPGRARTPRPPRRAQRKS